MRASIRCRRASLPTASAVSGSSGATYGYDGNGLRVVQSLQGGAATVSIYSGSSVIAEYDNGAAPTAPSREYIYNSAGGATTGLLAMISGGSTTYYHQDHESVRLTTDASGNVLTQVGTFPFGEPWYSAGQSNKWVFTSYQRDAETGLDYALARYYDSRTGTFCSADPLAGDPSDPQSWNRYPYGRNDPINVTDPSGKSWWSSLLIDVGVAVAAYFAPEAMGALAGGGSGAAFGTTTMTILETGYSSSAFYAWGANSAVLAGTISAGIQAGKDPNPFKNSPPFEGAKNLFKKPDCNHWLTNLTQAAYTNEFGPMTPEISQQVGGLVQNIPSVLDNTPTTYAPITNPSPSEGFVTNAQANLGSHPTMTLFKGFFDQAFLGQQSQIVLHEGVHLATNMGDRALARAAMRRTYPDTPRGNAQASSDWHRQLQKHCH